ncbi:hypothetical protein [Ramlibacter rhizophilus]|uniref:Phosphoglycerate mutase n=1 Tax=Ramlibacter rhizophilus TaxID=1781167 RepID=A0A4Z0BSG9_9BURK|nr:hypothetical protein [Ramlibacter rhizophilus]TFZ01380.1 hypothetical protein EZ242_08350 [Ramlibacter rhizophilus]
MSQGVHVLVAHASCAAPWCRDALGALALPKLSALLARLAPMGLDEGGPRMLSTPHERVLARACGFWAGDGHAPRAAWDLRRQGEDPAGAAWGWITPCHWAVATDHVRMQPPESLALEEGDSRALLDAMAPYFEEDGLQLRYQEPLRWLARGELLRGLACASLGRVSGAVVDDWLPRGPEARPLRRLQQEMQMLLYTHPVNEAREARGLLPVNSFWLSAAGALPEAAAPASPPIALDESLGPAAALGDEAAWQDAWRALDDGPIARLLDALAPDREVRLTLCGDSHAQTWALPPPGAWARATRLFRSAPTPAQVLASL